MYTGRWVERIGERGAHKTLFRTLRKWTNILIGKVQILVGLFLAGRSVEISLEHKEIAVVSGHRRVLVKCLTGRGWVAAEGDYYDYELGPGGEAVVGGSGKVTVTAYGPTAKFVITRASHALVRPVRIPARPAASRFGPCRTGCRSPE